MKLFKLIALSLLLFAILYTPVLANNSTNADSKAVGVFEPLVVGNALGVYTPESDVSLSQVVVLASRVHALHYGNTVDKDADLNYYLQYALDNGIVLEAEFSDYTKTAARRQAGQIVSRCLPKSCFEKINDITDIPDVDKKDKEFDSILTLYNAGILTGSNDYGFFRPNDSMTFKEAVTVIERTLFPEKRVKFSFDVYTEDEAYILCYQERGMVGNKEGISSGWQYDNRGSYPKTNHVMDYNTLTDVSQTDGAAMIREFNNTNTGILQLETHITIIPQAFDGFFLEYKNQAGETVYRLFTQNGSFYVATDNGAVPVTDNVRDDISFTLHIDVDLDNRKSTTAINKVNCGTYSLCTDKDNTNISSLYLATTDEGTPVVGLSNVHITANYGFYDLFENVVDGGIPYGWTGVGAANTKGTLDISSGGYAKRSFKPVSGVVAANMEFNLTKGQKTELVLMQGTKAVCTFSTDENAFYFGKTPVYENYVHNMWYRLRIEADTNSDKAKIWINGRVAATLPFENSAFCIDSVVINNKSDSSVSFDVINVFERKEHEDYVPEPIKPAGEEEYLIGLNICSLWKNGEHYGWACISAYDDREPVLGYYDEGNPETADWEIKYMVEHGIDFQAFCWYADQKNAPMKKMHLSPHLYDGYMYSKYSDKMKYCLIWEAQNASTPQNLEAWNKYYVPYFIENFFKDERYLVIDNKPVLSVFGANGLKEDLALTAPNETVAQLFDSLEKAVVEQLGFDGLILVACGSASSNIEEMGFDAVHAYGWGNTGYSFEVNKKSILNSASYSGNVYTIPTISMGFNSIPWHNIRYPIMTVDNYRKSHEWVRDEFLPQYCEKGSWNENFLWLSTWNEYGEGTYIMPAYGNGEFGYLDVIREVYTDEKADEELNLIPSAEQRRRINRLYPQHFRILRKGGYYTQQADPEALEHVSTVDYSKYTSDFRYSNVKDVSFTENGFSAVTNGDSMIYANNLSVNADYVTHVAVTVQAYPGTSVEVFFQRSTDSAMDQDRSSKFYVTESGMNTYYIDMTLNPLWKGTITSFRVDVGQCGKGAGDPAIHSYTLKSCKFMHLDVPSKHMVINGERFEMQLPYRQNENGDMFFAFDPKISLDLRLGMFMTWDYLTKTLTLDNGTTNAVYTVGSNTVTVDGEKRALGFTLEDFDVLPLLSVKQLCETFGYTWSINENNEVEIFTHEYDFFLEQQNKSPACWEFNTPGQNEGWSSYNMRLLTYGGYMSATSTTQSNDPVINQSEELNLDASAFTKVTVRCRFKCQSTGSGYITIYFGTKADPKHDQKKIISMRLGTADSAGEWKTYTYDLSTQPLWTGTVTSLRFDPFASPGSMDIDYIRFE